MATKLGRKVIHHDRLLPINFHDPPITWSCEITWNTKTIISPLSQWLRPRNLVGWWLILKGSNSHNVLITWSCKVTWQTKIIRSLLPISSTYGHQQGSDRNFPESSRFSRWFKTKSSERLLRHRICTDFCKYVFFVNC